MIRIAAISRKKYESGELCRFFAIFRLLADYINRLDSVKAQLRIDVKRILRKYHYPPPDKQVQATQTILEQAELLCADCVETTQTSEAWNWGDNGCSRLGDATTTDKQN